MAGAHPTEHPDPGVSEDEFAFLLRRAGLDVDDGTRRTLRAVHGHLQRMLERNRVVAGGGDRARGAEPATVFVPGQGWPGQGWGAS